MTLLPPTYKQLLQEEQPRRHDNPKQSTEIQHRHPKHDEPLQTPASQSPWRACPVIRHSDAGHCCLPNRVFGRGCATCCLEVCIFCSTSSLGLALEIGPVLGLLLRSAASRTTSLPPCAAHEQATRWCSRTLQALKPMVLSQPTRASFTTSGASS